MKDSEFIRGKIPMTKEEVRSIVLSKLALKPDDNLMDIGAGTGSVSIEAALQLTKGRVIAMEHKLEAVDLIHQNIQKHALKNVDVIATKAPEGMNDLSTIHKYFIGGSGGNLEEILDTILKQTQTCTIVITAILLDTLYKAHQYFCDKGMDVEIVQVSINKVEAGKKLAMLQAQNAIFILTANKTEHDS